MGLRCEVFVPGESCAEILCEGRRVGVIEPLIRVGVRSFFFVGVMEALVREDVIEPLYCDESCGKRVTRGRDEIFN